MYTISGKQYIVKLGVVRYNVTFVQSQSRWCLLPHVRVTKWVLSANVFVYQLGFARVARQLYMGPDGSMTDEPDP